MTATAVSSNKTINIAGIDPVELTVEERGEGRPYLVLHGGAGPQSLARFAQLLADTDRKWGTNVPQMETPELVLQAI